MKKWILLSILVLMLLQGCSKSEVETKPAEMDLKKDTFESISNSISAANTDTTPPIIKVKDVQFVEGDQVWVRDLAEAYDISGIQSFTQVSDDSQNVNIVIISADEPVVLEAVDYYGNKSIKEIKPDVITNRETLPRGRRFVSFFWFPYFQEENFVSEEVYDDLKSAYANVYPTGKFESGNIDSYSLYQEKFGELLSNEIGFYNPITEEEMRISDYNTVLGNDFNPKECQYYFFDMNLDGNPELCLKGLTYLLIFQYDLQRDRVFLWNEYLLTSYYSILESQMILYDRGGIRQTFMKLDEDGKVVYSLNFAMCGYEKDGEEELQEAYMVSLPCFTDEDKQLEITDDMKQQGYIEGDTGIYYFRVTAEQFEELTNDWYAAEQKAEEGLKAVEYTYEELFGE